MEIQMKYEVLIRMAHNCPRYGVPEADATIYDNYHGINHEFEDGIRLGKIITSIRYAVAKVLKKHVAKLSKDLQEELDELADGELINPTKQDLDRVVNRIHEIFQQIGLQVGL